MRGLAPDYRTIVVFRDDIQRPIVVVSVAFAQFCRDQNFVDGRFVALDGTKMRAVATPKNIAAAERLVHDVTHTEKKIAYHLEPSIWRAAVWLMCSVSGASPDRVRPETRLIG